MSELEEDGPPLGVIETLALSTRSLALAEDSAVVLYTDGVVDAHRESAAGERALHDVLRAWAGRRFAENAEALQDRVIGDVPGGDDAAMLIVRVLAAEELDVMFPATARDSHRARLAVQRYVAGTAMSEGRAYDFTLAVAEAMNNAAEHAYKGAAGTVSLHLSSHAGALIATVEDGGRWRRGKTPDRGRGLMLMQALADQCDIRRSESGTTITLAMRLPLAAAASRTA